MGYLDVELSEENLLALPVTERERALSGLRRLREMRRANPLLAYNPLPHQHKLHKDQRRLRALLGGNRAGKTTGGVADDLIEVTPRDLLPFHLREYKREDWTCPRYCRCMAPSNKLLQTILIQKFRELTPKAILKDGKFGNSFSKQENILYLTCGCRIDFMSYEMSLDKFGGAALHRCHYDEEPPEDIRDECYARLIDFGGIELFTMTPMQGMTWMYDDVWLAAEADPDGKIYAASASMLDNTHLDPEAVEDALDEWQGDEQYEARVEGRFIHFGGMVYPTFEEAKVDEIDPTWVSSCDVVVGIDPGVAGGCMVWGAFDSRNDLVVFDERFFKGLDVAQVCEAIDEVNERWGLESRRRPGRPVLYVIDPSARARSITHAVTIESEFNANGIYPHTGENDREAGCFMVRRRIRSGSLEVARNCTRLFWEAKRYRVQPREDGKWDVVKEHDHAMDALRYLVMLRPWMPEPVEVSKRRGPEYAQGPPKPRLGRAARGPLE